MKFPTSLAIALLVSAAACSDPSGPIDNGQTRSITVNLCSGLAPGVWFAYQNQGGPWTRVTPNSSGQIVFDATEKVSVASAASLFGLTFTEILNATATELEATASTSCEEDFGDRSMSGTVTGLSGEESARISAGGSFDLATATSPSWLLEDLPNLALDIVATRYATAFTQPANRVVVRRGVTPNNGSVAALDFSGAESAALESAIVTFTGIPANGSLSMATSVRTASGTNHELADMQSSPVGATSQGVAYVSLPASLRIASDMHFMSAAAYNSIATQTIEHYYKAPAAKTLAFGPIISEPTITNPATSPIVRPRVQVASQAAYSSALVVDLGESIGETSRYVGIITTAGFLGGVPATWDVSVPDMSAAEYNPDWGLETTTYNWSISAYGLTGGTTSLLGVAPADGLTVTASTRGKVEVIELGVSQQRALRGLRRLLPTIR